MVNISGHVAHGLELGQTPEEVTESLDTTVLARLSMERPDAIWRVEACKDLPAASDQFL